MVVQPRPAVRCVADAERVERFLGQTASRRVGESRIGSLAQLPVEIRRRFAVDAVQFIPLAVVIFAPLDRDAVLLRQLFDGFGEVEVVILLDELDHITAFAAAEAVKVLPLLGHNKGGRLFLVERTEPFVVDAGAF